MIHLYDKFDMFIFTLSSTMLMVFYSMSQYCVMTGDSGSSLRSNAVFFIFLVVDIVFFVCLFVCICVCIYVYVLYFNSVCVDVGHVAAWYK